jgi:hypothetical protein
VRVGVGVGLGVRVGVGVGVSVAVAVGSGVSVGDGATTWHAQMKSVAITANAVLLDFDWRITPPPFAGAR